MSISLKEFHIKDDATAVLPALANKTFDRQIYIDLSFAGSVLPTLG